MFGVSSIDIGYTKQANILANRMYPDVHPPFMHDQSTLSMLLDLRFQALREAISMAVNPHVLFPEVVPRHSMLVYRKGAMADDAGVRLQGDIYFETEEMLGDAICLQLDRHFEQSGDTVITLENEEIAAFVFRTIDIGEHLDALGLEAEHLDLGFAG